MSGRPPNDQPERRRNPVLRELLDELIALVRRLSNEASALPPPQLAAAQERLEWLADEIWESATRSK